MCSLKYCSGDKCSYLRIKSDWSALNRSRLDVSLLSSLALPARCTQSFAFSQLFSVTILSYRPRLRANTSKCALYWMVNSFSEGSTFILAGVRVRQAACFAVPGYLGYCCAFYRCDEPSCVHCLTPRTSVRLTRKPTLPNVICSNDEPVGGREVLGQVRVPSCRADSCRAGGAGRSYCSGE